MYVKCSQQYRSLQIPQYSRSAYSTVLFNKMIKHQRGFNPNHQSLNFLLKVKNACQNFLLIFHKKKHNIQRVFVIVPFDRSKVPTPYGALRLFLKFRI
jgi:hypothetical protein